MYVKADKTTRRNTRVDGRRERRLGPRWGAMLRMGKRLRKASRLNAMEALRYEQVAPEAAFSRVGWVVHAPSMPDRNQFLRQLLAAMVEFRDGDFDVGMPFDLTGVAGKLADVFNDAVAVNSRRASEVAPAPN